MNQPISFKHPPVTVKADGSPRRVGFELEFSGLSLEEAVKAVTSSLNGKVLQGTAAEQAIEVDALGNFNVELDWDFLKRKADEHQDSSDELNWVEPVSEAASLLVPVEVVCPPIPLAELKALNPMVDALRKAGATGTEESFLAAYGVHVNTEIPALDAGTIFSYLRAYCLLQWWLVEAHSVNTTRKLSPYIDLYSEDYIKQLLTRSNPDMDTLFSDYLEHNATRNRALDMLPLFAEIDQERVRKAVQDPKVKARPAFHYRLPNCNIEAEDWSLARSWNNWCVIEELAQRQDALDELGEAFLEADRILIGVNRNQWVEHIDQWLKNHELA